MSKELLEFEEKFYRENRKLISKSCASFTSRILENQNTQVDDANDYDIVMLMHNLLEKYFKASGSLWQYFRDEPSDLIMDSE